jgi:hypothetical protein
MAGKGSAKLALNRWATNNQLAPIASYLCFDKGPVSVALLDSGRRYCLLFTDLANPTSNQIYRQIGYWPVCDVDLYTWRSG